MSADFQDFLRDKLFLPLPVIRRLGQRDVDDPAVFHFLRRVIRLGNGKDHRLFHMEQLSQHFPLIGFERAAGWGEVDHQISKLDIFLSQFTVFHRQGVKPRRIHPSEALGQCIVLDRRRGFSGIFGKVVNDTNLTIFLAGFAVILDLAVVRLVQVLIGGIPQIPTADKVSQSAFPGVYVGKDQS